MKPKNKQIELENLGQDTQQSLHRDNIAQVYLLNEGDPETQRRAKDRIDFIVDNVDLGKVLEIGCSEGITSIKVAKKGCDVRGIDIHPEAIEFARSLANKMLSKSDKKPEFVVVDFFSLTSIAPEYDTVILGEVIEHVYEPQNMLKRAFLALKPGGKMIVTTPWGYMPAPDHHQTFFLTDLLKIIPNEIVIQSLDVVDDYIRLTGTKSSDISIAHHDENINFPPLTTLLKLSEGAALASQVFLRQVIDDKQERLEASWDAANRLNSSINLLEEKIKSLQKTNKSLSEDNKRLREKTLYQKVKNIAKYLLGYEKNS